MPPEVFLSPESAANLESDSSDLFVVVLTAVVAVTVAVAVVNGSGVVEYPRTIDCSGHVIFRSTGSCP